jgi:hypothetical protein
VPAAISSWLIFINMEPTSVRCAIEGHARKEDPTGV